MSIVDQYLKTIPPAHHELVQLLDSIISQSAPSLIPSLKWGNLTYGTAKNVCAIVTHKNHVNLQFFQGAHLDDPLRALTGTGKDMRHIKLVGVSDVDNEYVTFLLRQQV